MKPNKFTLHLFSFFYKSAANICYSFHFSSSVTAFFLLISFVSFAGEVNSNTPASTNNNKCSSFLSVASPLTGTESMRTNLYLLNSNNTTILADGVLTEYNNLYHDSVMLEDAYKFTNINENLGLNRYGKILAVERRPIILLTDTVFLKLWKTTKRNYQLEFVTINLNHPDLEAFLEDAYLHTRTLLSLSGITKINFTVNTDTASGNAHRFKIVYQAGSSIASTLPVTFTSVKGYQLSSKISIDWKVENEMNIEKYDVERSANGTDFIKINSIGVAGLNSVSGSYSWIDNNPGSGNNFYRIKSIDKDGSKKFSLIVKVVTGKINTGSVTIYPNPIKGNIVNLQFSNQPTGVYQVRLISNNGQVMYFGKFPIYSSNISQTLITNKKLAGGIYQLEIKAPDNSVNIQQAIVQE